VAYQHLKNKATNKHGLQKFFFITFTSTEYCISESNLKKLVITEKSLRKCRKLVHTQPFILNRFEVAPSRIHEDRDKINKSF